MPAFPVSATQLGVAVEATRGTAAAPTAWLPITAPNHSPMLNMIEDKALRGSSVDIYDLIPGLRWDDYDFGGGVFLDTFPILILAQLGSPDTISGVGPYVHKFSLLNDGQPPSLTLTDYDGGEWRQITAAQMDELGLKFVATGLLEHTSKFVGNGFVTPTSPTPSFSAQRSAPAWSVVCKIGGTAITYIQDGTVDFKRGTKPIEALTGTQSPYEYFAGPLDTSGKITVIEQSGAPELADYLSGATESIEFTFTDPASSDTMDILMSTCRFKTGKINRGKEYVSVDLDFVALPNATDATAGGLSPVVISVTNAQAAAY